MEFIPRVIQIQFTPTMEIDVGTEYNLLSYQGGYTSYNYTSGTNVYKPNGYYYGDNQW